MSTELIYVIFFAFVILVIIILLIRELNCWYWKINKGISLLEEQNSLLKKLVYGKDKEDKPQEVIDTRKYMPNN